MFYEKKSKEKGQNTSKYITQTSPYKSNPRFAPNIYLKWGKSGVGVENEKYSLYLNFIEKHVKYTYLYSFKFDLYSIVAFKTNS